MIELNDAISWLMRRWRSFRERQYIAQVASVAPMQIDDAYRRVLLWSSLRKRAGARDEIVRKALCYSSSNPQLRAALMNKLTGLLDERRDFGRKHVDRQLLNHIPSTVNRESTSVELFNFQKQLLQSVLDEHDQMLLDNEPRNSLTLHPELADYIAKQLKRELKLLRRDYTETTMLHELLEKFDVEL